MTPVLPMTRREAEQFAQSYTQLYGGTKQNAADMVEILLAESAKLLERQGTQDATPEIGSELRPSVSKSFAIFDDCSCGLCGTVVSQKAMWDHPNPDDVHPMITKGADTGPQVDDKLLKQWLKSVDGVLREQAKEVIKLIKSEGTPTEGTVSRVVRLLRSARWDSELVAGMRPYIASALERGAEIGMRNLSALAKSPAVAQMGWSSSELSSSVDKASTVLASRAATAVNGYTEVRVRELIGDGLQKGEDVNQLADRVQEWAKGEDGEDGEEETMTRRRARTIARTEAARAHSSAELDAWKSTGLVSGKRWELAPDACAFCTAAAEAYGQEPVALDQPFFTKGEELGGADGKGALAIDFEDIQAPPLHPNCRCATLPVLIDRYEDIAAEAERRIRGGKPKEIEP